MKNNKIQKAQFGKILKKMWNTLSNATQVAQIAESPSVMTASGWRVDKNGKALQDQQNNPAVKQLRDNLATIGEAATIAPTGVKDIELAYQAVRHPLQTASAVKSAAIQAAKASKQLVSRGKNAVQKFRERQNDIDYQRIYPENGWFRLFSKMKNKQWKGMIPYRDVGKKKYSIDQIKRNYLEAKRDVYKYFSSQEFKDRALNAGFSDKEIPQLAQEINEILKGTKFNPTNLKAESYARNGGSVLTNNYTVQINRRKKVSKEQLRANVIHELMHSVGGKTTSPVSSLNPMLSKLRNYNDKLQKLVRESDVNKYYRSNEVAQFVENQGFNKWFSEHFANRNASGAEWNLREVFNKPWEFRSRMAATLDYLRNKGYNTSELIQNPSKFKDWINELRTEKANVPFDLNHLLQVANLDDLANYASKMLTTSGVVYSGSKMLNNE